MKLYIDRDRNTFINSVGFSAPVTSVSFKRGDAAQIELVYVSNNTALSATEDKQITFGIKASGDYDGDYLVSASAYTASGTSYILNPNFNTVSLSAALNGGDSLNTMLEVSWSEDAGSTFYSTNTITAVIYNDVIKGGEASPVPNQTLLEWLDSYSLSSYRVAHTTLSATSYQLNEANAGSNRQISFTSVSAVTVTIDPNLTYNPNAAYIWNLRQRGSGLVSLSAVGVTVNGHLKMAGQNTSMSVIQAALSTFETEGGVA